MDDGGARAAITLLPRAGHPLEKNKFSAKKSGIGEAIVGRKRPEDQQFGAVGDGAKRACCDRSDLVAPEKNFTFASNRISRRWQTKRRESSHYFGDGG